VLLALGSALALVLMQWPAASATAIARQGRVAAVIATIAYITSLAFGGADIVAGGASALVSEAAWSAALKSTLATSALIGVPAALLALWAFGSRQPWALWGSAGLLVASFLVTGHAATAPPVALAATTVALHLAGAGFWFAALRPLAAAASTESAEVAARTMDQFSTRALWLVGALLVSGALVSWIQVRTPTALLATDYGIRLAVKLGLVALLLAFAAYNKWRLTPALHAAGAGAGPSMARSIRFETIVMMLVVAAAASLTMPTPPRALSAQAAAQTTGVMSMAAAETGDFAATWTATDYAVDISVSPAKPGQNMIMLRFKKASGEPMAMKSASIDAALPAAQLEGISLEGAAMPPDMFHFTVSDMIIPGDWQLTVSAFVDDFDKVTFSGTVPIK
jgi:copper transport protein